MASKSDEKCIMRICCFIKNQHQNKFIHERISSVLNNKTIPLDSWIKLNKNDEGGKKNETIASLFEAENSEIYENIN